MATKMQRDTNTIYVFDVDGTLTPARLTIEPVMEEFMQDLCSKVNVAVVGGSDLVKIAEQMGGEDVVKKYEYFFSQNGLVAYKDGVKIGEQSILKHMGEEKLQKVINFSLKYISELTLPAKRGSFIEFRSSMLNVSPIGRSCTQEERMAFVAYDEEYGVRDKFKAALEKEFASLGLQFAIGGQISIDVFPVGWDKTYCLQFLEQDGYKNIHFFGDKTAKGGNDHEIYEDSRTVGHTVTSPADTRKQVTALLNSQ